MTMWSDPATPVDQVELRFGEGQDTKLLQNFSGATRYRDSLFLAADERCGIDRLSLEGGIWADHHCFQLSSLLDLADPDDEADLEGLAVDDGWLWIVGSHARTRPKLGKKNEDCIDLDELADLNDTRPRCLLARIPLKQQGRQWLPIHQDGKRRSGLVRQTKRGNALSKQLRKDPLLAPFTRIPAKEGGIDVEGVAVLGSRVALGLRGPVIRTHAVLLEMEIVGKKSGSLELVGPIAKRLLDLEGLGIRARHPGSQTLRRRSPHSCWADGGTERSLCNLQVGWLGPGSSAARTKGSAAQARASDRPAVWARGRSSGGSGALA
jgi:hypothetical protein